MAIICALLFFHILTLLVQGLGRIGLETLLPDCDFFLPRRLSVTPSYERASSLHHTSTGRDK
jgi:hypothetical protein